MLTLHNKQLSKLSAERRQAYRLRLLEFLNRKMPERCREFGEKRTEAIVDWSLDRSRHHGLKTEQEMARFTLLGMLFGINFDEDEPWAKQALTLEVGNDKKLWALQDGAKKALEDR
jgi:hypothetical protein